MEPRSPQENLELIVAEVRATNAFLKNIRKHLIVIAIPFWLSLIGLALTIFCWLSGVAAYLTAGS